MPFIDLRPLECTQRFPCQSNIQPRIRFWVSIFSHYGEGEVVFHDSRYPSRVFSSLSGNASCTRSRNTAESQYIEKERDRIKDLLINLSRKLKKSGAVFSEEEKYYLNLYDAPTSEALYEASKHVRCQSGNKHKFEEGLARYLAYQDRIKPLLSAYELPEEILYLPFVESSYNPNAVSRVGAAGLWQIMPATARSLGLKVDASIDERLDPFLATEAAAKYLSESYLILEKHVTNLKMAYNLGDLGPFAITSYNYGIGGAKKMVEEVGLDFSKVLEDYSSRTSRVAVKNFYASFAAARHVAINKGTYFGSTQPAPLPDFKTLEIQKPISARQIATYFKVPLSELEALNPAISWRVWKDRKYIPVGYAFRLPPDSDKSKTFTAGIWNQVIAPLKYEEERYKVRSGDTACAIARRFQVSCRNLITENQLNRRGFIRIGQILTIPKPKPKADVVAMESSKDETDPKEPLGPELSRQMTLKQQADQGPTEEQYTALGVGEDLFVQHLFKSQKEVEYFLYVEPEETLGHYADWLNEKNTTRLKRLNQLKGSDIILGQRLILPVSDQAKIDRFNQERIGYHQAIQEEIQNQFAISGTQKYVIQTGDTQEKIAQEYNLPLWIIRRFNPDILADEFKAGDHLILPVLVEK